MRFISKLTMTVAAIFFALSFSAQADGAFCAAKSDQVCGKWVEAGWLAPWLEEHGYCCAVLSYYAGQQGVVVDVNSRARTKAKACLRDDIGCPSGNECFDYGQNCP